MCLCLMFLLVFKNPLLSARRMRFSKKMDQLLTYKKATLGPVLTLQHIYIYTHA